jgi:hypothetical protein
VILFAYLATGAALTTAFVAYETLDTGSVPRWTLEAYAVGVPLWPWFVWDVARREVFDGR